MVAPTGGAFQVSKGTLKEAAMPEIIVVTLVFTRPTKRTYRYDADETDEENPPVTTLYVQQTAFPGGPPQAISVTVVALDTE